jgi:hypothetical protein
MFKWQIDIDRHSPRLKPNHSHLSDPPHFSLLSTFKVQIQAFFRVSCVAIGLNMTQLGILRLYLLKLEQEKS